MGQRGPGETSVKGRYLGGSLGMIGTEVGVRFLLLAGIVRSGTEAFGDAF
jgi:hypothetical protein